MLKRFLFFVFLLILTVSLSGCFIKIRTKKPGNDGGIYKSFDKGESWVRKISIPTSGSEKPTIERVNTHRIVFDPQDSEALYLATYENGLYYTYDGGENWMHVDDLGDVKINAAVVDPNSKCILYTAIGNRIYQSNDCSRTWENRYVDTRANAEIKTLAIDFYNSAILYGGLSTGELIESSNSGRDWHTIMRFDDSVEKILINPQDTRIFYVATANRGVHKTVNRGAEWKYLGESLGKFPDTNAFRDIQLDSNKPNTLFHLSRYGILRSDDGGENWSPLNLIPPPSRVEIYSLAINVQNTNEIYYGTDSTFNKSSDGGQSWQTKRLPTGRAANIIVVNPLVPNVIYMGVRSLQK